LIKINLIITIITTPKIDTNTTDSQNLSGQLPIPTEPPQGDATRSGGLGQQQPSPQQNQNQTKHPWNS
jgi:hypothetical protein